MEGENFGQECKNGVGMAIVFDFDFFIWLCGKNLAIGTYATKYWRGTLNWML